MTSLPPDCWASTCFRTTLSGTASVAGRCCSRTSWLTSARRSHPPPQADSTSAAGALGWPAYRVADGVTTHQLWGGGAYVYNRNDPSIVTENGFGLCGRERGWSG